MIGIIDQLGKNNTLRILEKDIDGVKYFYIQKKFLWFWIYITEMIDIGAYAYRVYSDFEDAKSFILKYREEQNKLKNQKITKKIWNI